MDLCAFENEEPEHGVGSGVNSTLLSDTLKSIGLGVCRKGKDLVSKKAH